MWRGNAISRSASSPASELASASARRGRRLGTSGDQPVATDEYTPPSPDDTIVPSTERDQLTAIMQGLADGITVQALDGSFVYANAAAARLIGYPSVEQLLAASVSEVMERFELMDESGRPFPLAQLPSRRAFAGETPPEALLRFRVVATGEERWSLVKAAPIFDNDGTVRFAVNVFHDVTEQKRTEAALRDSEAGYRLMFEGNPLPIWVFDVETLQFLAVNDAAINHYGYTRDEFLGMTLLDVRPPEDVPPLLNKVARVKDDPTGLDVAGTWRHRTKDGSIVEMEVTTHAVTFAGRSARMSLNIDVTERKRAAHRIARLQLMTAALAEALTPADVAQAIMEHGVAAFGAHASAFALVTEAGDLEITHSIGYPADLIDTWRRFSIDAPMPLAEAARRGEALWIPTSDQILDRYPDLAPALAAAGSQAIAAVPLLLDGRALGGIGLSFTNDQAFDEEDRTFALAMARQCAQALERARLYEAERAARAEAEAAGRRLAFLDRASALLAGSLDYQAMLTDLARLAVPRLADWCVVHIVKDDSTLSQLAVTHVDPARAVWAREIQARYPPDPSAPYGAPHVVRTGRSELYAEISDDMLAAAAHDEEHLKLLREVGLSSAMIVPLVARDRTLGAITFVAAESGRRFGPADLTLAEDVARRAAAAVDNARLYDEARQAEERTRRDAGRLQALAESSRAFAEEGLEYGALLETIARQITETVGDLCVIRLLSEDGAWFIPAAVYHPDPAERAFIHDLLAGHPHPRHEGLIGQVEQSGRPVLIPSVTPAEMRQRVRPEYRPIVDRFGIRTTLIVPLRTRGRVDGAVVVMRSAADQPFTLDDQAFLQDLADRAALAIDNARLYRQAQEAVHARDQFLSIAAHELRTPVTGVKGYAQMLLHAQERDTLDPSRLAQGLSRINQASDRLASLTNDLLDVSRIRLGQLPLRPRLLDLGALVHEVAARYHDQLTERYQLILDVGDAPCSVYGDADRLEQVLTNLIDNAIKYSPKGGTIRVSLTPDPDDDALALAIQDEGIGLPQGGEEAIFEPFGRADNAAAASIPGLGLGLYICRSILKRHNGRIWAESAGEGRGTTLHVWLPCEERGAGDGLWPPTPSPSPQ